MSNNTTWYASPKINMQNMSNNMRNNVKMIQCKKHLEGLYTMIGHIGHIRHIYAPPCGPGPGPGPLCRSSWWGSQSESEFDSEVEKVLSLRLSWLNENEYVSFIFPADWDDSSWCRQLLPWQPGSTVYTGTFKLWQRSDPVWIHSMI